MFGTDILTVLRQALDEDGDPVGEPVEIESGGWYVQPRGVSSELTDQRQTVTTGWLAFGPPDADVRPADRVRWGGVSGLLEVVGDPAKWGPPEGPPHHLEVVLERVKG